MFYNLIKLLNNVFVSRMRILKLTMWDQFVTSECTEIMEIVSKKPVIAGHRVRVTSFNGIYSNIYSYFSTSCKCYKSFYMLRLYFQFV